MNKKFGYQKVIKNARIVETPKLQLLFDRAKAFKVNQ